MLSCVNCRIAHLLRAVEQIKGVYCSAQPALYGICSTASQFESVSLVYCLEAMVCAFFSKVSALRLKPFESWVPTTISHSVSEWFFLFLCEWSLLYLVRRCNAPYGAYWMGFAVAGCV